MDESFIFAGFDLVGFFIEVEFACSYFKLHLN